MSILLKTLIKSRHWDTKVDIENRKVDIQDKKVDIEQYLVLEKENVNLKGISILTVCIPLIT